MITNYQVGQRMVILQRLNGNCHNEPISRCVFQHWKQCCKANNKPSTISSIKNMFLSGFNYQGFRSVVHIHSMNNFIYIGYIILYNIIYIVISLLNRRQNHIATSLLLGTHYMTVYLAATLLLSTIDPVYPLSCSNLKLWNHKSWKHKSQYSCI